MRRDGAGGTRTWVLDFCSQYNAYFYHISSTTGYIEYGNLSSDGAWDYEIIDIQSAVNTALDEAKESGMFDGVSSWNDLKDKPFEEVQHGDTLTWDGNPNGMVVFEDLDEEESFAKIADNIPTLEDLEKSVTVEWLGDYALTYLGDADGCVINGQEFGYMAIADSDGLDCLLVIQEAGVRGAPETGIYFRYRPEQDSYIQSFHIPDYAFISIKKIDSKYLPKPDYLGMIAALEERVAALEKQ